MTITRNNDGYSALAADSPLSDIVFGDMVKYATLFDDFLAYDKTQLIGGVPYTLTQTNGVDTIAGPTGILTLTLAGADNDLAQLQTVEAPFALSATKRFWFEARVKCTLNDAALNELFIGMASKQTGTAFMNTGGTAMTADDMAGFVLYDGSPLMDIIQAENDSQSTDTEIFTIVTAIWNTYSIYWDGATMTYYVNGDVVGTLTGNPPTSIVAPTLYIKAGEAQGNILECDYILCVNER